MAHFGQAEMPALERAAYAAADGDVSLIVLPRAMGDSAIVELAVHPSGFMPVTRRAPFLVLALWAGGRANTYFGYSPKGTVNMADVNTKLELAAYESMWTSSVEDTHRRLQDPQHDAKWLRRVAFCLARSDIARHWPLAPS